MILADLYQIIEVERTCASEITLQATVRLNPEHDLFKGHFPGHPVLPGVCMLHIIKAIVQKDAGLSLSYSSIQSCKYVAVVKPVVEPVLTFQITYRTDGDLILLTAEGTNREQTFIKLKSKLTAHEA